MKRREFLKLTSMFAFLVFVSAAGTSVQSAYGQCKSDEAIVSAIYAKIEPNSKLQSQVSHINVSATGGAVKIMGWAENKSDHDKVVQFAFEETCTLVNDKYFYETEAEGNSLMGGGGCSGGTKPCGDICIPENDSCNIRSKSGM